MAKKRFHFAAFGFLLIFFVTTFLLRDAISVASIQFYDEIFFQFVDAHYAAAVLMFLFAAVILVNSPIPFAAVLELIGGYLFGFWLGGLINMVAMIIGSVAGYLIASYLFFDLIHRRFKKPILKIEDDVHKYGASYLIALRFIMTFPYFLINYSAGVMRMSFLKFLSATIIGVIPSALIYAYVGNTLREVGMIEDIFKPQVILMLAILVS